MMTPDLRRILDMCIAQRGRPTLATEAQKAAAVADAQKLKSKDEILDLFVSRLFEWEDAAAALDIKGTA